jgi:hypothetical protein
VALRQTVRWTKAIIKDFADLPDFLIFSICEIFEDESERTLIDIDPNRSIPQLVTRLLLARYHPVTDLRLIIGPFLDTIVLHYRPTSVLSCKSVLMGRETAVYSSNLKKVVTGYHEQFIENKSRHSRSSFPKSSTP